MASLGEFNYRSTMGIGPNGSNVLKNIENEHYKSVCLIYAR